MNSTITTPAGGHGTGGTCDTTTAVTRSLLGYGVIAGPIYLTAGLIQALTRDGFDLGRHDLSLLANGPLGWIQVANLVITGLMTIAAAVGLGRALRAGRGGTWGPRLIGVSGARRFADRGQRGWARYSRITGIVFLAGFAGIAAGSGHPAAVLGLWVAVIAALTWLSALSAHLYATTDGVEPR